MNYKTAQDNIQKIFKKIDKQYGSEFHKDCTKLGICDFSFTKAGYIMIGIITVDDKQYIGVAPNIILEQQHNRIISCDKDCMAILYTMQQYTLYEPKMEYVKPMFEHINRILLKKKQIEQWLNLDRISQDFV